VEPVGIREVERSPETGTHLGELVLVPRHLRLGLGQPSPQPLELGAQIGRVGAGGGAGGGAGAGVGAGAGAGGGAGAGARSNPVPQFACGLAQRAPRSLERHDVVPALLSEGGPLTAVPDENGPLSRYRVRLAARHPDTLRTRCTIDALIHRFVIWCR